VTLLVGPQTSLTILMTIGFAGSATAMYAVLRRWDRSRPAAVLAGAVFGFSPALLHSAIGHYDLQFAVFLPLIVDAALRLLTAQTSPQTGPRTSPQTSPQTGPRTSPQTSPRTSPQTSPRRGGIWRDGFWRDGFWLGLLVTAQLMVNEEMLFDTAVAGTVVVLVLMIRRWPRAEVAARVRHVAKGLAVACGVTLVLAGYPLWIQFFGPLPQSGSPFTLDYFKNDLSGLIVPSSMMFFHTAASAAAADSFQGQLPEYLAYLGLPLIVMLVAGAIRFWRRPAVRALAVAWVVTEVLSLGGTLLASGHEYELAKLPWYWVQGLPLLASVIPDRFSIVADGAAAALLAFIIDASVPVVTDLAHRLPARFTTRLPASPSTRLARRLPASPSTRLARRLPASLARRLPPRLARLLPAGLPTGRPARPAAGRWPAVVVMCCAVLAVLPLVPRPLPATEATPLPAGWTTVFSQLGLPASANVLVVPIPMATFTAPLRWQADTGMPASMVGGYFMGPAWNGHAYIDGDGTPPAGLYLNRLWEISAPSIPYALSAQLPPGASISSGKYVPVRAVSDSAMLAQLKTWQTAAVVAVTTPNSPLGLYLTAILGRPAMAAGDVLAWRT
jgi:hypothetical protein